MRVTLQISFPQSPKCRGREESSHCAVFPGESDRGGARERRRAMTSDGGVGGEGGNLKRLGQVEEELVVEERLVEEGTT